MKPKLEMRNALITGASRGIGRAIALRFAEEGANLFLCARTAGPLEETAAEIRKLGVKVATQVADVSDQKSVREMVQQALQAFGQIDILVNNAGVHIGSPFIEYSLEDFDRIIKVNLYGVFHVTQAVLPGMMARKKGKVVNIASTAGKWGSKDQSAYNASKHGIVGLTRCIALEMGPYNINVNAVCPALVETDMPKALFEDMPKKLGVSKEEFMKTLKSHNPLNRIFQPEEVAHLALFLASDEADGMTAQSISLCGGYLMI